MLCMNRHSLCMIWEGPWNLFNPVMAIDWSKLNILASAVVSASVHIFTVKQNIKWGWLTMKGQYSPNQLHIVRISSISTVCIVLLICSNWRPFHKDGKVAAKVLIPATGWRTLVPWLHKSIIFRLFCQVPKSLCIITFIGAAGSHLLAAACYTPRTLRKKGDTDIMSGH